ncbi:5183_t:CDS:1, partial [Entrophospora sp. SA101]
MRYLQMVIQVNSGKKRKKKQLTKAEKVLLERFKSVVDCHRRIVAISQKQIAQDICMESEVKIGLDQSMVSKMYIGIDVPK